MYVCYMNVILNVNIKVWIKKRRKKTNNHHRADDGKKDHPQPFTFAYIHINVSTYMCIVIYGTPVCIEGNLLWKVNAPLMRFRPYYTSTTLVYSANPFTYCFSTHAFFTLLQSIKKSCHKLKALILKMSNLHIILLYRYVHGRYTTHTVHTHL